MRTGYKHGTHGEFNNTVNPTPAQSGTIPVYVGVAPVHLVNGWKEKDVVNYPVKIASIDHVKKYMGFTSDWDTYTLCEAFSAHFSNDVAAAGPIVAINVLDPDTHKKAEKKTEQLAFVNDVAKISSNTIIVDTAVVANAVLGVDYTIEYDFETGNAVITRLTSSVADSASITYSEIDVSNIDKSTIIGSKSPGGAYTGLSCLNLVYPELGIVANIIDIPKYSQEPDVYKAMLKAAEKINGHWYAWVNADIPVTSASMESAITWKKTNGYVSERSKVCWPKWKLKDGKVYHMSTIATWLMTVVDSQNDGVPMESPSNKEIPAGKQYFGADSVNRGYDQDMANKLNANGITTAVYWGGKTVLWGPHPAAFVDDDNVDQRSVFDTNMRMMMYILNSYQQEHGEMIDKPMTKALSDTIKNREQEKLDALVAVGALIGQPKIERVESDVSNGDFEWKAVITSTPPFKSGTLGLAFSAEGFAAYEEGGEE